MGVRGGVGAGREGIGGGGVGAGSGGGFGPVDVILDVAGDVLGDADEVALNACGHGADVGWQAAGGDERDDEAAWVGFDLALHGDGHDGGEDVGHGGELRAFDEGSGVGFEVGFDFGEVGFYFGDF